MIVNLDVSSHLIILKTLFCLVLVHLTLFCCIHNSGTLRLEGFMTADHLAARDLS